jgi:hypothetical protein
MRAIVEDLNPLYQKLKGLDQRAEALRGYL